MRVVSVVGAVHWALFLILTRGNVAKFELSAGDRMSVFQRSTGLTREHFVQPGLWRQFSAVLSMSGHVGLDF